MFRRRLVVSIFKKLLPKAICNKNDIHRKCVISQPIRNCFAEKQILQPPERSLVELPGEDDTPDKEGNAIDAVDDENEYGPEWMDSLGTQISRASFNLAAFADRSYTIQQLFKLGVNIASVEEERTAAQFFMEADFDRDMKPHIEYLVEQGINPDELGKFITLNPYIFAQDIDNLDIRIAYLKSKRLTHEDILTIIKLYPRFINFKVETIDAELGFLQSQFRLTGEHVRIILKKDPQIINAHTYMMREYTFSFKEEMGFTEDELRSIIVECPKILHQRERKYIVERFDFIHNELSIPHNLIVKYPVVLLKSLRSLKERHGYLSALGRAQYDPKKPGYIPLKALYNVHDIQFISKYAKTTIDDYNVYLKTL